MLKATDLRSWEDFENALALLPRWQDRPRHSPFLFRGQSDSEHLLETTLDRVGPGPMSMIDYYRIVSTVKPEIEAHTGQRWPFPEMGKIREFALSYDQVSWDLLGYEFLAHLRHHGFPSPLLDWSRSPYVAAYFACRNYRKSDAPDKKFSIYAFCERLTGAKATSSSDARISTFGPVVGTHHRHFRQQSEYSICIQFDREYGWKFARHESVAVPYESDVTQDVVWKFNVPISECPKILGILSRYNLNAYSLFGTEESLAESLSIREFVLTK